jgi:hypothetical protein
MTEALFRSKSESNPPGSSVFCLSRIIFNIDLKCGWGKSMERVLGVADGLKKGAIFLRTEVVVKSGATFKFLRGLFLR